MTLIRTHILKTQDKTAVALASTMLINDEYHHQIQRAGTILIDQGLSHLIYVGSNSDGATLWEKEDGTTLVIWPNTWSDGAAVENKPLW